MDWKKKVLNLVISGIPSIHPISSKSFSVSFVLNLVISGIPSIPLLQMSTWLIIYCFKPCYKWNTFNTMVGGFAHWVFTRVLNLVISGIPSILGQRISF